MASSPSRRPNPGAGPPPTALSARQRKAKTVKAAGKKAPWGWLEWAVLAQTAFPALLFVPGTSPIRVVTRIGAFSVALLALVWSAVLARRRPGAESFAAAYCLAGCAVLLLLSIFHPTTNSLTSGAGSAALYIAVMSPAFWAASALSSSRQLGRIMAILLLCNSASALVGLGQVFRPATFNPPVVAKQGILSDEDLAITTASGDKIFRPCGLSDTPANAANAGLIAGLAGLGWALAPVAKWKRLIGFGLAFIGMVVIYFSQMRLMLIVQLVALVTMIALFLARRDFRRASLMMTASAILFFGAIAWVARTGGDEVLKRFKDLTAENPYETYSYNRGSFVEYAFSYLLPEYPLGAGLGRWGQMYEYFGDHNAPPERGMLWPEIQIGGWVIDGGGPLLFGYGIALVLAIYDSGRIAIKGKDRTVALWATVVCSLNLGIAISCFGGPTFVTPLGLQFWILAAAVHAADVRSQSELRASPS